MSSRDPAPAEAVPAGPGLLDWIGVAVLCLSAMLAAAIESLLVPLYLGSVLIPVAVVFAIVSNVALPRMAGRLVPRPVAVLLPFAAWLLVIVVFGVLARPEGDVILPGGSGALHYVSYGVMLGGALAGTITVVVTAPQRRPR